MSQSKMFRAIALLSCLPLSTALLESLRNLELPADTTSWDYLHTRDPYFNRTGSYFNGVLKVWRNPYTEDSALNECADSGDSGAQYYHSVAWLGPSLDDGSGMASRNTVVDHNNIQAWLVGMPTEKFSDSLLPTYEPTGGGSTTWMEWTPDFPADIKAQVKKTAESIKMRDFPFSMDTSVYGWNIDSTSTTPDQVLDLVGQIGTTTSANIASYNKYYAEYNAYYNSYDSSDSYDPYDYNYPDLYSSSTTTTTITSSSSTPTATPPTSYAYDLQWYYSPAPSTIESNARLLPTLNTNTGTAHTSNNPFASHIYFSSCPSTPGRLLLGHGAQSQWPSGTPVGPISPQASALNEFYASTGSSREIQAGKSFHYIRASISHDGRNFTILGTNRYHFNRTAKADVFAAISDSAPEGWYPDPIDHADDSLRSETEFVDVMWQFEGRLDEEASSNRLNVTQLSPSRDFPSDGSVYRWERENEQGVLASEVKVVAGGQRSGVAKVVGEGWAVGLGVVAVVFIGWM